MSWAIDLEATTFCSLRREGRRLVGRKCPAVYIAVPPSESERRLLERAGVPYAVCDGNLLIYGEHAVGLAPLLHVPVYPALPQGRLPVADPVARQLIAMMLESLLAPKIEPGAPCGLILPADVDDEGAAQDAEFFEHFLRLQGCAPSLLNRPMALILAELGRSRFTGMAVVIDSLTTTACIAHHGVLIAEASVRRGASWLQEELARRTDRTVWDTAGNAYLDTGSVATWAAQRAPSIETPHDPDGEKLVELYDELLAALMAAIATNVAEASILKTFTRSMPVVCCGAATQIDGFERRFTRHLRTIELPVEVADVRVIDEQDFVLARGALVRAELESRTRACEISGRNAPSRGGQEAA